MSSSLCVCVPHRERYENISLQSTRAPLLEAACSCSENMPRLCRSYFHFLKNGGWLLSLSLETKVDLQWKKVQKMDGVFVMNRMYSFKLAFFVKKVLLAFFRRTPCILRGEETRGEERDVTGSSLHHPKGEWLTEVCGVVRGCEGFMYIGVS